MQTLRCISCAWVPAAAGLGGTSCGLHACSRAATAHCESWQGLAASLPGLGQYVCLVVGSHASSDLVWL